MHWECSPSLSTTQDSRPSTLRLYGLAAALPSLVLLLAASAVHPRQSGYGTHEQLLLPPCGFLARTGWPCVTCGVTTSVSAMAHGQWGLALRAQPFGIVLFLAAALLAAAGSLQVLTARDVIGVFRPGLGWVVLAVVGLLGGWICKVGAGVWSGQLPLH